MRNKLLTTFLCATVMVSAGTSNRTAIGQTANIEIPELNLTYLARVDSGARITSIHAVNITLVDEKGNVIKEREDDPSKHIKNEHYKDNVGKTIAFDTITAKGEKVHYASKVEKVAKVSNAQGKEYRYVIKLTLNYKDVSKKVEVNLRDRSKMQYKLLIGRNWLHEDFYILTDKKEK